MAGFGSAERAKALAAVTAAGQPHEIAVQTVDGRPERVFVRAPLTLRDLYEQTLSDLDFLVFEDEPERYSFSGAYALAARMAHILTSRYGVRRGDRVAISMRNYPEWMVAFQAITSIGAIAVAMNALWQPEEMEYALRDCGAKVLFADRERLERLAGCPAIPGLSVIAVRTDPGAHAVALTDLLAAETREAMPGSEVGPEDLALILYTSGSTGHPKGVPSTHRMIISALLSWETEAAAHALATGAPPPPPGYRPAALLAVPLFHVMGTHVVFLSSFRPQRKVVSMYRWDPARAAALVEKERITAFSAPSAMTGDLVREALRAGRDLSSLASVGGGGAPRPPEQVRQIASTFAGAAPGTGWGMTETNGIGTIISGDEYLQRPTSAGRCLAVLDLKVIDEAGVEVPPGERGELLVRGTAVFKGYWNRPELNSEVFIDEWFRTGDVATIDGEGFVAIVDRIKDLIIRGGENIGCGQVEAALALHPHVREAAVYGLPDPRLGEEVGATVYADALVDPEGLREFLEPHLARFEIPMSIRVVSTPLPRTGSGKILKRALKEEHVKALGAGG